MSKEYYNEVNQWKLKSFFLNVLKTEGRRYMVSRKSEEELADLLATKLIAKLNKETK